MEQQDGVQYVGVKIQSAVCASIVLKKHVTVQHWGSLMWSLWLRGIRYLLYIRLHDVHTIYGIRVGATEHSKEWMRR